MATKLGRKEMPSGYNADDFKYQGRPATSTDQDDFGPDVGIADMVCVNQFGDSNNNKYYHAGVVNANGAWFVYLEWGRVSGNGKSWEPNFRGQDFQFVSCSNEDDARAFFQKQCRSKNIKRLQKKKVGNKEIWVGKNGKDGYVIQRLATRERGLPDAYAIKDDTGVEKKATTKKTSKKKTKAKKKIDAQPQVIALAKSLVGGTADYARAASKSAGVTPTMEAITEVRDELIPEALELIKKIGDDTDKQLKSKKLQDLSTYVATIVPRPIPRGGDASAVILNSNNIFLVQQDLDAFEAALKNEDWEVEIQEDNQVDPNKMLNAEIEWLDVQNGHGKWVADIFRNMTNNRHGHLRQNCRVTNVFSIRRPKFDDFFIKSVKTLAAKHRGNNYDRARLQPKHRNDVSDISDMYEDANVFLAIHGTRAVNIGPIIQTNFRMPKALKNVHITGAAFGAGWYAATDWRKSAGYVGHKNSYYGGGGHIRGRNYFMFLCDAAMGRPYMAKTTLWGRPNCPRGYDSVAAYPEYTSVANDEHVLFDANRQRIRYLVELDF